MNLHRSTATQTAPTPSRGHHNGSPSGVARALGVLKRGQETRVDQHEEREMAGTRSNIDMQDASGHDDARNLRSATGAAPVGVNSKSGELPERLPARVERFADGAETGRSPAPHWWQSFRAGHGAWMRRLAASLLVFAVLGTALPAAAQTDVWTATLTPGDIGSGNETWRTR